MATERAAAMGVARVLTAEQMAWLAARGITYSVQVVAGAVREVFTGPGLEAAEGLEGRFDLWAIDRCADRDWDLPAHEAASAEVRRWTGAELRTDALRRLARESAARG